MMCWVAGATGAVGTELLARLAPVAEVTALSRRAIPDVPDRATVRIVDFESLEASLAGESADAVFCCLGTTRKKAGSAEAFRRVDLDYVVALARAGRAAGATRFFLVSSVGASPTAAGLYLKTKGEAERGVEALGFEELHIFRPGLLTGERQERRRGEELAKRLAPLVDKMMRGPLDRYKSIPAADVAQAMLRCFERPAPGRHVHEGSALAALATDR